MAAAASRGSARAPAAPAPAPSVRRCERTYGKTFAAVPRDFSQKVNRKMYRGAIRSIVAELNRQGHLIIAENFAVEGPKTSGLLEKLKQLGANDILIVTERSIRTCICPRAVLHTAVGVCDGRGDQPGVTAVHWRRS